MKQARTTQALHYSVKRQAWAALEVCTPVDPIDPNNPVDPINPIDPTPRGRPY